MPMAASRTDSGTAASAPGGISTMRATTAPINAVATALVAGVVARIVLIPPGALATVPLSVRLAAIGIGFAAFLLIRRSAFAGVLAGEAVLVLGALAFG